MIPARALLVFDTSALHHFALADRLDVLGSFVEGHVAVTTNAVRQELERSAAGDGWLGRLSAADWLVTRHVDDLDELVPLGRWLERTGAGRYDRGEATVLAHAEVHHGVAIMDDKRATRLGRGFGVEVHGTLRIIADACAAGRTSAAAVAGLIDTLRASGARYPCDGAGFGEWMRANPSRPVERRKVRIVR